MIESIRIYFFTTYWVFKDLKTLEFQLLFSHLFLIFSNILIRYVFQPSKDVIGFICIINIHLLFPLLFNPSLIDLSIFNFSLTQGNFPLFIWKFPFTVFFVLFLWDKFVGRWASVSHLLSLIISTFILLYVLWNFFRLILKFFYGFCFIKSQFYF